MVNQYDDLETYAGIPVQEDLAQTEHQAETNIEDTKPRSGQKPVSRDHGSVAGDTKRNGITKLNTTKSSGRNIGGDSTDKVVTLRKTVAGMELYAKAADYDSDGNRISTSLAAKANVADLAITDVSGDVTKKNIQLANGLNQDVLVAHQDISGLTGCAVTYQNGELHLDFSANQS